MNCLSKIILAALAAAAAWTAVPAWAMPFDAGDLPDRRLNRIIPELIVTGNFQTPRRLAFLTQEATKSPVLLLPAPDSADRNIYFIVPDGKDPAVVSPEDFPRFISWVNPRRIIVVGGPETVPAPYRTAIPKSYPVSDVPTALPDAAALTLANLVNSQRIVRRWEALKNKDMREFNAELRKIREKDGVK